MATWPHDDGVLIFLHLGKTAGTTLGPVMDRQVKHDELYAIHLFKENDQLIAQPESVRAKLRLVRGLTYYGIHDHLPRQATYFTMLRHPIDRIISQYFYNFRRAERAGKHKKERPIEVEIEKTPMMPRSQISKIIGGATIWAVSENPLPDNALALAKQRLESFPVVGFQEYFDESLLMMANTFGWGNVTYAARNVAPDKSQRNKISPESLKFVEQAAAPEIEMYTWARARFEAELKDQPPAFQRDLAALRERSRRYGALYNRTAWLRSTPAYKAFRRVFWPGWTPPELDEE